MRERLTNYKNLKLKCDGSDESWHICSFGYTKKYSKWMNSSKHEYFSQEINFHKLKTIKCIQICLKNISKLQGQIFFYFPILSNPLKPSDIKEHTINDEI